MLHLFLSFHLHLPIYLMESSSIESLVLLLLPHERTTPQRVVVDIDIEYDYTEGEFINYADVAISVESHLVSSKYELLEDALNGLRDMLLPQYSAITKLAIKIAKPDIIPNCRVSLSDRWIIG